MWHSRGRLIIIVGIKYCGGCNPDYDRVALVNDLKAALRDNAIFINASNKKADIVLVVCGCLTACADVNAFSNTDKLVIRSKDQTDHIVCMLQNLVSCHASDDMTL